MHTKNRMKDDSMRVRGRLRVTNGSKCIVDLQKSFVLFFFCHLSHQGVETCFFVHPMLLFIYSKSQKK